MKKNSFSTGHLLVLRFSAMGDVALVTPVIKSLAQSYPDLKISIATRPKFAIFFQDIPKVDIVQVDLDNDFKGFGGIFRLFAELRKSNPTLVIDVHDHLRTKFLRFFFFLTGVKTVVFQKGRAEKKKFVRPTHKLRSSLLHTVVRYQRAFVNAGLDFSFLNGPFLTTSSKSRQELQEWLSSRNIANQNWIGIAPFAAYVSKIWPLKKYSEVIEKLSATGSYHFFLFGGGASEVKQLAELQSKFTNVTSIAGELKLNCELALIEKLSLMVCGDSSNMHLAALTNVPVVSVWGGTHPDLGFGPWGQNEKAIVQIPVEELPCRPCSVYGTNKCLRGDFACLTRITPDAVVKRALERLT